MTVEISDTRIKIDPSFVGLICLMMIFCQQKTVAVSVICSVLHECGHLVLMCIYGDVPEKITVSAFGMRIDRRYGNLSYKKEAIVCMGGIAVNIFVAAIFFCIYFYCGVITAAEIAFINIFIAAVNMMPVGILDFASALRCILYMKCDVKKVNIISEGISLAFLIMFIIMSIVYCVFIRVNISLVAVTVYLVTSYKKRS